MSRRPRNPIQPGDGDPRHGTAGGYTNHGCRCAACRAANARMNLRARETRRVKLADDDPRHGQDATYTNHGCRCASCRAAHAIASRDRAARRRARRRAGASS